MGREFYLKQTRIVVVAGRLCTFWHPNQTKRHYERAAEAQIAGLKNQAASHQQQSAQQKNDLLNQIEELHTSALQEIEATYLSSYTVTIEEFTKAKNIHEESLLALSFFGCMAKLL